MKSASKIVAFPRASRRRQREELAFLPAALEIVETPASPTIRATAAILIALFCFALAWACLGKIDIVASATGRIIPSDRTKLIQPFETGVVRAIHVRDGQSVKAGEILIELDPTMNEAELQHLNNDLLSAQLDVSRLRTAIAGHSDALDDPPAAATPALIEMHLKFLQSQQSEQNARLSEIDRQKAQKEAERDTAAASIAKIEALIPLSSERVGVRKYLADREYGSKLQYLTDLQELVGMQQDVLVQKSRLQEAQAAVAALEETRAKTASEYRRQLFDDLVKATQKAGSLAEDVRKAERRTQLQLLTAPIDGIVQQLAVHTVGGVVTPAEALAVVVPVDRHIEIEAQVPNREVGFVHAGQAAEIKVDTFSFTRYGLLHGKVLSVSSDSIVKTTKDGAPNDATAMGDSSSEPKGQELVFIARISVDRTRMLVDDKEVALSPGMAVTADIKTGSRTVISYLLSPLLKYRQESLRER